MSTRETIQDLYNQYLKNEISKEELIDFLKLLDTPEGELNLSKLMDGTWAEMFETNTKPVVAFRKRTWYPAAVAAAILFIIFAGVYTFLKKPTQENLSTEPLSSNSKTGNDLKPGGNKAILTLADGSQVILDTVNNGAVTQQGNVTILKLDEGQLTYSSSSASSITKPEFNTISTPRGGQYQLVLSDGSKIWLNSESSLTFPILFNGNERNVTLKGEGYFEIAKDIGKPFRVTANNVNVEVLGTHFNINAYADESSIKTTLLEGSVKVKADNHSIILSPGEQARYHPEDKKMQTLKNVPTNSIVAWKEGYFSFNKDSLQEVMRQLARWYDVEIKYEGKINAREFGGKIDMKSNASQVLKILEESNIHFRIEGKVIVVTP